MNDKHEQREREREQEHEQRERERARERDQRQEQRDEHGQPEPKALSGADLGRIADAAREAWAGRTQGAFTDGLGRGWGFTLLSEPFPGLKVECGDLALGLTEMALSVEHPDPLRRVIEDLAKAVPAAA